MDKSIVNLTLCSGVLYDKFVQDLHKENEALRDELFWTMYGPDILRKLLRKANDESFPPVCNCHECFLSLRFNPASSGDNPTSIAAWFKSAEEDSVECIVKKCLIFHAQRLGLVVVETVDWIARLDRVDAHIHIDHSRGKWEVFYGSKMPLQKFRSNPDLPKLTELFELLEKQGRTREEFFEINGVGHWHALRRTSADRRFKKWWVARYGGALASTNP